MAAAARRAPSSSAEPEPETETSGRVRPKRTARDFALLRLGRRAHGVTELSRKMERAGYGAGEIREALDFLLERRYLDDASFAKDYARSAADHKKWGPLRIERALLELGIAEPDVEAALAPVFRGGDGAGETTRAADVLAHFRRSKKPSDDPRRDRARAHRHLLSRGFSPDVVQSLLSSDDIEDTDSLDDPS